MDESSLLDLLECSVCLERLDTTARVLPCQHTFCRRCLQSIVSSRNELRCPECRILVECGVDDLPANILLVRLLDGIRQRPRNSPTGSPTAGGHHCAGSNNSNNHSPGCAATGGTSNLRDLAAASHNAILLAKGPRHRWSLESCLCDSSPATTLRFTYDHGQVISLVVIVVFRPSQDIGFTFLVHKCRRSTGTSTPSILRCTESSGAEVPVTRRHDNEVRRQIYL
ncbi:unnamed protein product [Ranitomeya imitator]|uniref:RING-type domain-containing protein n=1 Tax=Ranitomeya imitator TaxID=111125 RepID=A0ABN9M7U7_9NEOB|nr:unnamed protein product [Ranitomeya imitator]